MENDDIEMLKDEVNRRTSICVSSVTDKVEKMRIFRMQSSDVLRRACILLNYISRAKQLNSGKRANAPTYQITKDAMYNMYLHISGSSYCKVNNELQLASEEYCIRRKKLEGEHPMNGLAVPAIKSCYY